MLKVLTVKRKWITVQQGEKTEEIPINWYTRDMRNGDEFSKLAELRIKNSPHHELYCSKCSSSLEGKESNYYTWKQNIQSKYCRHCGARFMNLYDMETNHTLETMSSHELNHKGITRI